MGFRPDNQFPEVSHPQRILAPNLADGNMLLYPGRYANSWQPLTADSWTLMADG
jgi:hypothetical protein